MKNRVVFFNAVKSGLKTICLIFLSILFLLNMAIKFQTLSLEVQNAVCCFKAEEKANKETSNQISSGFINIKDIITDFFFPKAKTQEKVEKPMVYVGGYPLGFTLECEGVLIVSLGEVETENGTVFPAKDKNIKEGDILKSVDGVIVKSASHLHSLLNSNEDPKEVELEILRGKTQIFQKIVPAKEASSNMFRLGFWIRDNAAGVGTLTYVRADNMRFGSLGHPVCDIDTGKLMPVAGGNIYKCNVVGVNKGTRGTAGELRGLFLKNGLTAGTVDANNEYGVYGTMKDDYVKNLGQPVEIGLRDEVKTGKAKILCTIDGNTPKEYDIEIVKLNHQSKSDKKSMVIKIVDKELIEQTGGIVQGMSGSPILQNGKLVGAVTHVFVSDPTKGFGIYIDWMIQN